MTPAEIQRELDELDTRLERLRIKYDQFFTGIEKMLPYVQRKDVDRRFQALHRVQMRNTGMRFRFQTLVQRFTSYQTYWNRITRQIEEGTFRRDVIKAQRMGLGAAAVAAAKQAAETPQETSLETPSELPDDDVEELEGLEPEPEAPIVPPPLRDGFRDPLVGPRVAPAVTPLDNIKEPSVARPLPTTDPPAPVAPPQVFSMPPQRPGPPAPPLPPGASRVPSPPGAARPPVPGTPSLRAPPPPPAAAAGASPGGVSLPPGTRPSSPNVPAVGSGGVPSSGAASVPPRPPLGRLGAARPPTPSAAASSPPTPAPASAPAPVAPVAPVASAASPPHTQPAARPVVQPAQPPRPAAAPSPAVPTRPAPSTAPSVRPAPATGEDTAMRQLYDRYLAARKQTGETTDVRYETVAKQVRETLPRLAEKYQGADVRLDVTIKDGKAILRPVVTMKKPE